MSVWLLSCKKASASRWTDHTRVLFPLPLALRPILICVELSAPVTLTLTRGNTERRRAPVCSWICARSRSQCQSVSRAAPQRTVVGPAWRTEVNNCTCESCPERGWLDFGEFLGFGRDSSPSQGGFQDELWAGGLKDGQTFPYSGEFLLWRSFLKSIKKSSISLEELRLVCVLWITILSLLKDLHLFLLVRSF